MGASLWLLVLSGVVEADRQRNRNAAFLNETVTFLPGKSVSLGVGLNEGPLNFAINHYSIPRPSSDLRDYTTVFSLEDFSWAPFACLSAIFDQAESINAGYAVWAWRPHHFVHAVKYPETNQPINRIFTGINVDIGISDNDAFIKRLAYHITLLGRIAFAANGSIG